MAEYMALQPENSYQRMALSQHRRGVQMFVLCLIVMISLMVMHALYADSDEFQQDIKSADVSESYVHPIQSNDFMDSHWDNVIKQMKDEKHEKNDVQTAMFKIPPAIPASVPKAGFCSKMMPKVTPVNVNGAGNLRLAVYKSNDIVSNSYIRGGNWEASDVSWIIQRVNDGLFVDVGANVGGFTFQLLQKGKTVVAFEAMSENIKIILTTQHCLNPDSDFSKLTLFPFGLGEKDQACKLFSGNNNLGDGAIDCTGQFQADLDDVNNIYNVRDDVVIIHRMDDVMPSNIPIDVLKIDVEGFEMNVIQGALEVLKQVKHILIECNHVMLTSRGVDPMKIADILWESGFSCISEPGQMVCPAKHEPQTIPAGVMPSWCNGNNHHWSRF